jgi:threonine dehydrogenase-like Zn-dependent dehydrogenase
MASDEGTLNCPLVVRGTHLVTVLLPEMIDRVLNREMKPGKVFDLTLPLDQVADGYRATDDRRAIKTLLRP